MSCVYFRVKKKCASRKDWMQHSLGTRYLKMLLTRIRSKQPLKLNSMAPEYYEVMSIAQSSVQPPHTTRAEASSSRTQESTPTQELMTQILAIQSRLESFETWQARLEAIERGVPPPEDDRDRLHLHVDSSTMQFHRQQAQADLENVARLREVVVRLEMENEQLRRSQACDKTQPQPSTNHSDSEIISIST